MEGLDNYWIVVSSSYIYIYRPGCGLCGAGCRGVDVHM